jgi:hypothetical protein
MFTSHSPPANYMFFALLGGAAAVFTRLSAKETV